jgi:autotransporter-associated beta strand protein
MPKKHRLPSARRLTGGLAASFAGVALFSSPASAASDTWTGASDALWSNTGNWLGGSVPGTGDTATFNASSSFTTTDLGAGVTLGALVFDTSSAAAYTIGSGGAGVQTLTLGTTGNAITMNSTVAANQLINANLALTTTATPGTTSTYYAVTNNSLTNTLTLAGGISASTAGVKVLNVTGSGNTAISGAITSGTGNVSLFKTGAGTLTLSGGATWSGNGIKDGANFSTSEVFREGTTILNGGTYNASGTEVTIGGVATNGGVGTNTTLQIENGTTLTNLNWLSVGRGNGTGTVSSDLILNGNAQITSAQNMSAGFNAGNTGNTPKGTITLNGTSSVAISNTVNIAESAGSNITVNINDTATFSQTANANQTRVGMADNAVGTINVNGGTATFERDLSIGYSGTGTGRLNLTSGTVNVATGTKRWLIVGEQTSAKGEITVDGGNLNLNTNTDIRFGRNGTTAGTSFITLNGGAITSYSDNKTTALGAGVLDMNLASTNAGLNTTFNLNGGTLTIRQVLSTVSNGTRTFNFNGGTLKATGATTAFFNLGTGSTTANVRDGGAVIDSNTFDVTVAQPLVHSNIGGDNAIDGGLTKNGTGTLTLSGANTYTGNTTINAGGFTLASTGSMFFRITDSTNSEILGTGAGTFDGTFKLDLSGVTASNTWTLVNVGSLASANYGGTFTVVDNAGAITFTNNSGVWTGVASGVGTYTFTQSTGVLSLVAVPEPHEFALAIVALLGVMVFIRRRNQQV